MSDVQRRVDILESRVQKLQGGAGEAEIMEIKTQMEILQTLANFHGNRHAERRISELKGLLNTRWSHSIYNNRVKRDKIEMINEEVDRIVQTNEFINECVSGQGAFIDRLEFLIEGTESAMSQAHSELEVYRRAMKRRLRLLRSVILFMAIFLVIIFIRLFR